MNTTRILIGSLLLSFTLLSGLWLSHLGRPWNGAVFTLHKLAALGAVILLANIVYRLHQHISSSALSSAAIAVTGLLVLSLFISGGLLSASEPASGALLAVHRVVPWLVVVSTTSTIYLFTASWAR